MVFHLCVEKEAILFGELGHLLLPIFLQVTSVQLLFVLEFGQLVTCFVNFIQVHELKAHLIAILLEIINSLVSSSSHLVFISFLTL